MTITETVRDMQTYNRLSAATSRDPLTHNLPKKDQLQGQFINTRNQVNLSSGNSRNLSNL